MVELNECYNDYFDNDALCKLCDQYLHCVEKTFCKASLLEIEHDKLARNISKLIMDIHEVIKEYYKKENEKIAKENEILKANLKGSVEIMNYRLHEKDIEKEVEFDTLIKKLEQSRKEILLLKNRMGMKASFPEDVFKNKELIE